MFESNVAERIRASVGRLRVVSRRATVAEVQDALCDDLDFLDVSQLLLGKDDQAFREAISRELGQALLTRQQLQYLAVHDSQRVAEALQAIGVFEAIAQHVNREWSLEDVLIERYKATTAPQSWPEGRVPVLADFVAQELQEAQVAYEENVLFVGSADKTARCDFAVPSGSHPKVVIEAKEFDKIGYRFDEYCDEVLTIVKAKQKYFFLVTDGLGWHNRQSDLQKLVDYQNEGLIDMIYTRSTFSGLAADVKHIYEKE